MAETQEKILTTLQSLSSNQSQLLSNKSYLIAYSKRQTVPNTAHGNLFHVYKAMYTAFCYALQDNKSFEMHLEDEKFGDFDDMILITSNGIIATQYKHHLEETEQDFTDFITGNEKDTNKLSFRRYFDSLYQDIISNTTLTEYVFCSNNSLPKELKECLNEEQSKFSELFFEGKTPRLKYLRNLVFSSILKFSQHLNSSFQAVDALFEEACRAEPVKISKFMTGFISDMQCCDRLKEFSKPVTPQTLKTHISFFQETKAEKNKVHLKNAVLIWDLMLADFAVSKYPDLVNFVSKFLRTLKFEFDSINLEEVTNEVRNKIKSQFNTTNDVLYYAFFNEFYANLVSKKSIVITHQTVKKMFTKWRVNYIHIERLFGLSFPHLTNFAPARETLHEFHRPNELQILNTFLASPSSSYFILVNGIAGIGKSTFIRQALKNYSYKDGECIFIEARCLARYLEGTKDFSIEASEYLKLFVIDNAEFMLEKEFGNLILPFLIQMSKKNIKLILSSKTDGAQALISLAGKAGFLYYNELTVKQLPMAEILNTYPSLKNLSKIPSFFDLIRVPFYLSLIVKHYHYLEKQKISNDTQQVFLESFLVELAIKKSSSTSGSTSKSEIKQRKAILRKLVYCVPPGSFQFKSEDPLIVQLVQDNILSIENNRLCFAHLNFEEFVVKGLIEKQLRDSLESNETVKEFFEILERRLKHYQHLYLKFLLYNMDFIKLVIQFAPSISFKDMDVDPFVFLFVAGLKAKKDNAFLNQTLAYIRKLAHHEPDIVVTSLDEVIGKQIDLKSLKREFSGQLVLTIQIASMYPGSFTLAAELLLKLLTKNLVSDEIWDRLSEEFPKYFCHAGEMFPINYPEKMSFLKKHLCDDVFASQFIWEGLYYAADPSEFGDINQALESELIHGCPDRDIIFYTKEQNDYSTEALNLLLSNMTDDDWSFEIERYVLKILENNIGKTFFSMRDEKRLPQINNTPLVILNRIILTPDIIHKVRAFIFTAKEYDERRMEEFIKDLKYSRVIPNYPEHSALIRTQLSRIEAIIEKYINPTMYFQFLFRRSPDETTSYRRLYEEFITEHRHESLQLQRAYDECFGLVLKR